MFSLHDLFLSCLQCLPFSTAVLNKLALKVYIIMLILMMMMMRMMMMMMMRRMMMKMMMTMMRKRKGNQLQLSMNVLSKILLQEIYS